MKEQRCTSQDCGADLKDSDRMEIRTAMLGSGLRRSTPGLFCDWFCIAAHVAWMRANVGGYETSRKLKVRAAALA